MIDIRGELAGLAELTGAELKSKYRELTGEEPHTGNVSYMRRRCAWLIQARECGGLNEAARARAHEIARLSDLRLTPPTSAASRTVQRQLPATRDPRLPPVGTVLVRQYRGREIKVLALQRGFEFDGTIFKSLSAVANHITGTHCSGPRWFGLTERKR